METKNNIAEILKDKPKGTKLYSPIFGKCVFCYVREVIDDICVKHNGEKAFFSSEGLYNTLGEVMLFPSKEMRDWSKFSWKKGDILANGEGDYCVFKEFAHPSYQTIKAVFVKRNKESIHSDSCLSDTKDWHKASFSCTATYINTIEKEFGSKFNRETLEIENAQPEFKDGDILSCDEDTYTKHTTLILHKNGCVVESLVSLIRHHDLVESSVPINEVLLSRLYYAREDEKKELFEALAKKGKAWDAEKKKIVDLKPKVELKPFDKVLIRDFKDQAWQVSLFGYKDANNYYCCNGYCCNHCIPYKGNEHLLGTIKDVEG